MSIPRLLLILAVVGYACAFSYLTIVRYQSYEARALDMGNLSQAIWNTAHGDWFHLTNQPGTVNRLSLHVEPILIPISWLYLLYPDPPLLLLLQAVVVALGAIPIYALARYKLGSEWVGLAFALIYLLNPSIQAANWLEFHPLTLAPAFLLAAFFYLETDRPRRFALFAILAMSCKEEIALLIFMMGLYALLIRRRPRLGLITMALSLAWALFAVLGIQQLFADGNIHWGRYGYLGHSPTQMVLTLLTRPSVIWTQLSAANAGNYLWSLLWSTAFLSLLAPEVLILALPSLAINLLADFPPMHEVHTLIYAAPIVPFVLIAAVMGLARLKEWLGGRPMPPLFIAPALAALFLLLAGVDQHLYGYLPGSGNYMPLSVTAHHRRAAAIIAQIPTDAVVSAQDRLDPHVSGRKTIYIFPRLGDDPADVHSGPADTVWIDVTGPSWPQHPNDLHSDIEKLLAKGYGVAAADDGYLLLRKGITGTSIPDSFYTAWRAPEDKDKQGVGLQFGNVLKLLDFHMVTDRNGELVAEMEWMPLAKMDRNYHFYIAYVDADGNVLHGNDYYQPVSVLWYPTTLWEPGTPVRVSSLPWTLENDQFVPLLGVYDGDDWEDGKQLPIRSTISGTLTVTDSVAGAPFPLLQGGKLARLGGYQRTNSNQWQPISDDGPAPATPLNADFGGMIHLLGVDLPTQAHVGLELPFTLHWQANAPVDFDYTAFAHLLDEHGNKVAQVDWQPHDRLGLLPTSSWLLGQPVINTQHIALPSNLPAGHYTLLVGFYNWQTGDRLPAHGDDVTGGNAISLGPVQIN